MKVYRGERTDRGCEVYVSDGDRLGKRLSSRLDLRNHSPTGFEWGYGGSGPAQLALAMLADYLGPGGEQRALELYQRFKFRVIGHLIVDQWTLTAEDLDRAIRALEDGDL